MTWVMEEGTQAPVRENQGWREGEEMNNSWDSITLLSPSWISLIRILHFLKFFKRAIFCLSSTPNFQVLAAFIGKAFTYFTSFRYYCQFNFLFPCTRTFHMLYMSGVTSKQNWVKLDHCHVALQTCIHDALCSLHSLSGFSHATYAYYYFIFVLTHTTV